MNLDALRAVGGALVAPLPVAPLDPRADTLARALRPSYARARALHERMASGDVDIDGRSAAAVLREARRGHGGTRYACASCNLVGTVQGPGDTCRSCGYVHDARRGSGAHQARAVA